jgi:hypothetical protein
MLNFPFQITILIDYNYEKKFQKQKYFEYFQMIQSDKQINLKNIILYYLLIQKEKKIVKQLLYDIFQDEEQYKIILLKLIQFNQNEFAEDISVSILNSGG